MAPQKHAGAPFVAAGVAATVELCIMQPLDVVKTRMHLQGAGVKSGDNFQSTSRALMGIRAAEGLPGLWRGFIPGLCVVIPRRGFKFVFYENLISLIYSGDKKKAPFAQSMIAGGLAGAMEAVIITPIECVKIAMQSERAVASKQAPTGMINFTTSMVRSGGIGSLYSGLAATMSKHSAHSCFYFAAFHETRKLLPGSTNHKLQQVMTDLASGFVAGVAAATANNPFDVVKTRQQVGAAGGMQHHAAGKEFSMQNLSLVGWMAKLVREEGLGALYKGYIAKVARLGPGSAIIFCVYEQVLSLL
eukprot:TRINITY_DN19003_c0_g1_i1.p1 TRINITY_DN19003_c0_g1~~TRINITY_DN19003_c0_g1_i1.p1  ORF type:complete len:303 (-),score=36.29 TRINITY_DN19003_c0_g1_i1:43-951(-)